MKISEMLTKATYIECPDYNCQKWNDEKTSCIEDCPQREKLVQLIKCHNCEEIIVLDINYSRMRRVKHECYDGKKPLIIAPGTIITLREKIEGYINQKNPLK